MENDNKHYIKFVEKVHKILRNRGHDKYHYGYCIVQGKEANSYYIQSLQDSSKSEKLDNVRMMEVFINNLHEHLINNKPFKVIPKDAQYYINLGFDYENFFKELNPAFFNVAKDRYSRPVMLKLEEFKKTLNCFAPILNSIHSLFSEFSYNIEKINESHEKYLYTILSLDNNFKYYLDENDEYLASNIEDDLIELSNSYNDVVTFYEQGNKKKKFNQNLIKKGLINYLSNRKQYLLKIDDKDQNLNLFEKTRRVLEPSDWKEIASYIPNLSPKNTNNFDNGLVNLSEKPIFQINLNIANILDKSHTVVTSRDLFEITELLVESMNDKRPEGIDFITAIEIKENIHLIISGEKLNKDYSLKVCSIFEKMLGVYNSDNINKDLYKEGEEFEHNKKFLYKAAEAYWLDADLDNTNGLSNKKIKKI